MRVEEAELDSIFLTYKGSRLFDVTTCTSLGITADDKGRPVFGPDVDMDRSGRIRMLATTEEIYLAEKRRQAHEAEATENYEDHGMSVKTEKPAEDPLIQIVLVSQSSSEHRVRVKSVSSHD